MKAIQITSLIVIAMSVITGCSKNNYNPSIDTVKFHYSGFNYNR